MWVQELLGLEGEHRVMGAWRCEQHGVLEEEPRGAE